MRPSFFVLIVAACWIACAPANLPPVPKAKLESAPEIVRDRIQKAYKDVEARPKDAAANGRLGMVLQANDFPSEAAAMYERARLLDRKEYLWPYYLSVIKGREGKWKEAVPLLRDALEKNPENLPVQIRLGDALQQDGDFAASKKVFVAVVEKHERSPVAHFGLGRSLLSLNDFRGAAEHLQRACDLFPSYGQARQGLIQAYERLGDAANATRQQKLAESLLPQVAPINDPALRAVSDLDVGVSGHLRRGRAFMSAGLMQRALREFETAVAVDPKKMAARAHLLAVLGRLRERDRAAREYEAAVAIDPKSPAVHYNYAVILEEAGKRREAMASLRKSLEASPDMAPAHARLADLLRKEGQNRKAAEHYRKALEKIPNLASANGGLGLILFSQGDTKNAIDYLRKAAKARNPESIPVLEALARAYQKEGDADQARQARAEAKNLAGLFGGRSAAPPPAEPNAEP